MIDKKQEKEKKGVATVATKVKLESKSKNLLKGQSSNNQLKEPANIEEGFMDWDLYNEYFRKVTKEDKDKLAYLELKESNIDDLIKYL